LTNAVRYYEKINVYFDDYVLENTGIMVNFIKLLQDRSLALTKFILNCQNDNFKRWCFIIFKEATAAVANSTKNSSEDIVGISDYV
jgi:hypothetical protein